MKRVVTVLLLLAAGGAMLFAVLLRPRVGHPVTPLMLEAASATVGRVVPPIPGVGAGRPVVVIFIRPDCPCSEAYEPFTHALHRAYGDRVEVVGVVAGDDKSAGKWRREYGTPFRVVADRDRKLARGYGAERSAYTALLRADGRMERLWPGYSASMLAEVGSRLSAATGSALVPVEAKGAPKELNSGCPLTP